MRISVIAAFGVAIFLGGCQPTSQTNWSSAPPIPTSSVHPTQADYRLLTQYTGLAGYQKTIDAGTYNGTGVLHLNTKVVVDEKMGPAQNPLLSGLQSGGKPWQFIKRYAVQADDIVEYGAGDRGGRLCRQSCGSDIALGATATALELR